jgi:NADH-quinone oxidoreductase subunit N
MAILATVTMTVGNIAALTQKSFPRMIAYSSIAQAGYILIGLAFPTYYGLTGALFHIFNHAIMTAAAFMAAAGVFLTLKSTSVASYDGLAKRMPVTAFVLMLTLLALGGVPPLNGFWSKAVLFVAAVEGGALWVALAMALNSAFSLGYYAWIVKRMYFDEPVPVGLRHEPRGILLALSIAAFLILFVGVYPSPFFTWASQASLLGP